MGEHENWGFSTAEDEDFAAATIDELAEMFRLLDLPHALTGGHAVNQYTAPRLTYDLDFIVAPRLNGPERARRMLELLGYETQRTEGDGSGGPAFVRVMHPARRVMIDITEARTSFERSVLDRSVELEGLPFRVARPEDLIVSKLVAGRQRDQRDVLELAAIDGLDVPYIRYWANRWQVMDTFERLMG